MAEIKKKRNMQFEHGYSMGYDWMAHEGNSTYRIDTELRNRGSNPHKLTAWDHGFKKGAEDRTNNLPKKYGNE